MDPISIAGAAAATASAIGSIGELAEKVRDFKTGLAVSLPSFLKSTNIMSRTYIEDVLYEEEILPPVIGMLSQVYVGFVLTALQLNGNVAGSKKVRNLLEVVSSEDYSSMSDRIDNAFGNVKVSTEDGKVLSLEAKEQKLFSGRVLQVDLQLGHNQTTSVMMYVQLLPYLITEEVSKQIVSLNVGKDLGQRYRMMKTGEISFFWDYLFERDLINDKKKALKEDSTGVLYDILLHQSNALSKALLRHTGLVPHNHNLANAILIISESTFKEVCSKTNSNFDNKSSRDKFFKESFMMMVVIIDTMFNKVTIYYNGLDSKGVYSFKMIQANAGAGSSGSDKYDLKDIMTQMSHGMSPKF